MEEKAQNQIDQRDHDGVAKLLQPVLGAHVMQGDGQENQPARVPQVKDCAQHQVQCRDLDREKRVLLAALFFLLLLFHCLVIAALGAQALAAVLRHTVSSPFPAAEGSAAWYKMIIARLAQGEKKRGVQTL